MEPTSHTQHSHARLALVGHILALVLVLAAMPVSSQYGYTFTSTTGTYTNIATGTDVNTIEADDVHSATIPLGFTFVYNGVNITDVKVNSNGWVSLETTDAPSASTGRNNDIDGGSGATRPAIYPLWDDLDGASGSGVAKYETTGAVGSRVWTMEWRNWQWDWSATGITISFQCKLYETTNVIEFIYRQETGAYNNNFTGGACIGHARGTGSGNFHSLDNSGASPTSSTTVGTDNIQAKPSTNRLYRWTPVAPPPPPANDACANAIVIACGSTTAGTTVSSDAADAPVSCSSVTMNTAGGVWYTVMGNNSNMTAATCGSAYDNRIGVYSGACGALSCVIGEDNDNICTQGTGTNASVTWFAASGTTYFIYVTGTGTGTGTFTLTLSCLSNGAANGVAGACVPNLAAPAFSNPSNGGTRTPAMDIALPFSGLPTVLGAAPGQVQLASVELVITHPYQDDPVISLVSPSGQVRTLWNQASSSDSDDNLGNPTSCTVMRFIDTGAAQSTICPGLGTGNPTGNYAPNQTLAGFTGNPNGTWLLRLNDDFNADYGTLNHVKLNFTWTDCLGATNGPALPGTACDDLSTCTTGDVFGPTCVCAGTPIPSVTCPPNSAVCVNAAPFALSGGSPAGGTYSGTGVSGGSFDPAVAGVGPHTITYTDGCSNCNFTITVNALPVVTCGSYGPACSSDPDIALGGSPAGGTWSGTGVSGNNFDPSAGTQLVSYAFTDGNGCTNSCTTTINVTMATTWYADTDGDGYGDAGNTAAACSQPSGHVANDDDDCPTLFGLINDACDDGNPFTTGDAISMGCACIGTPVPCDTWSLTINTDGNGTQTTWQVKDATSPYVLDAGGPYPSNATIVESICVPQGACFDLIFNDSGNNGMNGGWVLRDNNNRRVIDNIGNGSAFTTSCQPDQEFCSPVGSDALTIGSCDKMTWLSHEYIVAAPNAAVSAQWGIGNQADDGYQFWFFDPTGGYNRRILHNHATSMGYGPPSAVRACHLPLTFNPFPLPMGTLLNVRVRGLVNGVYGSFGPACRFMVVAALPGCPTTQLDNNPLHIGTTYSCGVTGKMVGASGTAGKLWANIVPAATHYKWRLEVASEGYVRQTTTSNYFLVLGAWSTTPLLCGTYAYDVSVAVSTDGGATFCPFGPLCTVGITNSAPNPCTAPFQGGNQNLTMQDGAAFHMWPNPNRGDQLNLSLSEVEEGVSQVFVELYDVFGKRVMVQAIATDAGFTTVIELDNTLAGGIYTVNVVAGSQTHTERLVIQ